MSKSNFEFKGHVQKMRDQQGKSGESYGADKENNNFPYFEIMDRVLCDKQSCNPQHIYDPGRFKLKEKCGKLSEQYASLSDEEEYSDTNVSVNDSDASIHDKTVTSPLLESSMAKEKSEINGKLTRTFRMSRNRKRNPNRQRPMF